MMIAVLTGLLVVITGFYAWATYRILKANESVVGEMQRQTEQINRPYVQVALTHPRGNPIMKLLIKNTGRTPAERLSLAMDKDFFQFGENNPANNIRNFTAFTDRIDALAPGQELEFYLGVAHKIFADNADRQLLPLQFKVTAQYSFGDKTVTEENAMDLRPLLNTSLDRDDQTRALQEIEKTLKNIDRSASRLTSERR